MLVTVRVSGQPVGRQVTLAGCLTAACSQGFQFLSELVPFVLADVEFVNELFDVLLGLSHFLLLPVQEFFQVPDVGA